MLNPQCASVSIAGSLSFLFLFSSPLVLSAQQVSLGELEFPTSGATSAQPDFIRGVLYMHSFEYDYAADAFRKAQEADPNFAMAYWGEAMTHHHSLWAVQRLEAAQAVLMRLGDTSEARGTKAPTQREKDYVRAAEILFGMTAETRDLGKLERDVHYRNAMRKLHFAYPDDLEARAFYGLSILGVGSVDRDYATYIRAAAILTPVWDANRLHPGGAHYLIHSYDDPVHSILGLPMARAYGEYAVGASHAQHMTSHIYVALGLWDDMIAANVTALGIESSKTVGEGALSREAWHHRYWLHYGRLQKGQLEESNVMLRFSLDRLSDNPLPREPDYFGAMYARYLIDTENCDDAENWLAPENVEIAVPHYYFARAFCAAKLGQLDQARELSASMQPDGSANAEIILAPVELEILELEIDAVIALAEGNSEQALKTAREAVELQTSMPFRYGPPRISKPSAELLGDILLQLGHNEEAALVYQDQLTRSQLRTNSLLGLARASARAGDATTSQEAYSELANIWHDADSGFPALAEVRGKNL